MNEGTDHPVQTGPSSQSYSSKPQGSNIESSPSDQPPQVGQSSMEFAPMLSHSFNHPGGDLSPYDMRHISNALPDYAHPRYAQHQPQPQFTQGSTPDSNFTYATAPGQQQYLSQLAQMNPLFHRGYSAYSTNMAGSPPSMQNREQIYSPQQQFAYGSNMLQPHQHNMYVRQPLNQYMHPSGRMNPSYQVPRLEVSSTQTGYVGMSSQNPQVERRNSSSASIQKPSTLRGPPRKPKQSGHALWVGNLPPGTKIVDLKDYFSRDATEDIESVFLISKSNCAFVNYKTEESCAAAMTRFHDSRFRGVRLVCRLRRGSNSAISPSSATAPTEEQPNAMAAAVTDGPLPSDETSISTEKGPTAAPPPASENRVKEKFFIIKSLTIDDLERSVNSGIWATQSQNEEKLNNAFASAENVYLIFSANKSGEYYGYARMESEISPEVAPAKDATPVANTLPVAIPPSASADVPLTIPTPATATAPRGYIIDDSARGTIFWEAGHGNLTPGSANDPVSGESGNSSADESGQKSTATQQSTYGNPFKISWQSTERLPFYRARGLRNPWNANREVKIARDGTELEPSVGRKLIAMFEQQAQINFASRSAGPPPQFGFPPNMATYSAGVLPQAPYGYPQGPNNPYGPPY